MPQVVRAGGITLHTTLSRRTSTRTANIQLTQKALGLADLATTQIYTHIVDEELEGALKSLRYATVTT